MGKLTKGVRPFSRDRLMMVSRDEAARVAMLALTPIQDESPEHAMAAAALLFAVWCKRLSMSGHEAYQLGSKLLTPQQFHQKGNITMETLRDFAGIRMAADDRVELR